MEPSPKKSDSLISFPSDEDAHQKLPDSSIHMEHPSTPFRNSATFPKNAESLPEFRGEDKSTPEGFHFPIGDLQGVSVSLPDFDSTHAQNQAQQQAVYIHPPDLKKEMSFKKSKPYPNENPSCTSLGHLLADEEKDVVTENKSRRPATRMYSMPRSRYPLYRQNSNLPSSTRDDTGSLKEDIQAIVENQEQDDKGPIARDRWQSLIQMRRNSRDSKPKGVGAHLSVKQMELLHDFELYHEQNFKYFLKHLHNVRVPKSMKGSIPYVYSFQFQLESGQDRTLWARIKEPIHPNSKFRILWDLLVISLVILDLIVLPLQISFDLLNNFLVLDYITFGVFVLDIFLNFHTAYYKYGILVTSHKDIAKRYARSWLVIDLIAAFPFFVLNNIGPEVTSQFYDGERRQRYYQTIRLIKIVRIARFFKLRKISGRVSASLYNTQARSFWELLKLLFVALLTAHWIASIWHFIAVLEVDADYEETWFSNKGLQNDDAYFRYVNSFYWAVTTMLTVGYGDITPVTAPEIWFAVITMIIGCGFFAYIISTISSIVNELQQQKAKKRSKIYVINRFMAKHAMSKEVQLRIRSYMEFLLEEENNKKQDQEEFMNIMPESIKREVLIDLNGVLLAKNPIMSVNFGNSFLLDLATKLKEKTLGPEEDVYNDDDPDNSFYIITKGKIDLYLRKTNQSLKVLTVGDNFGHISFFSNKKRHVGAMSIFFSNVCYLKKKTFLKRIMRHPREHESYCYIRDKINFCNDYSVIKQSCFACGKENHAITECPDMQYIPDPQDIATLILLEEQEFRQTFIRKPRCRFHALKDQSKLNQEIEKFDQESSMNLPFLQLARGNTATFSKKVDHEDSISPEKSKSFLDMQNRIREPSGYELNVAELSVGTDLTQLAEIYDHSKGGEEQIDLDDSQSSTGGSRRRKRQYIILDKMRSYQVYFPHNNVENIIKRINRIHELETRPVPRIQAPKRKLFSQATVPMSKIDSPSHRNHHSHHAHPLKYSGFWRKRDDKHKQEKPVEEEHANPSTRNTLDLELARDAEHGNEQNETPKSQAHSLWTINPGQ